MSRTETTTGTARPPTSEHNKGLIQGLSAYVMWGLLPLYFIAISMASPLEIVANRIVWSLVFCALLLTFARAWPQFIALSKDRAAVAKLALAAFLIAINWLTYTYAALNGQVVEASLGYFMNPLISAALGVLVLKERLSRLQWTAMGFGLGAVVVLFIAYGKIPYIALALGFSFGLYGLVKNRVGRTATALTSLTMETALLALPAAGVMAWLIARGESTVFTAGPLHLWLMIAGGIITAVPLLLFGASARRLPLSLVGALQFVAPILQFSLAVVVLHEPMPPERLAGFSLVWVAVILVCLDLARQSKRRATLAA